MLTLKLAFRNLFRNTRRTVLTVMLIGFSLTALILTDALVVGMLDLMVNSVTKNLVGDAQIHRNGFRENYDVDYYIEGTQKIASELSEDPAIEEYAVRALSGGMVSSSYNVTTGMLYGVEPEAEARIGNLKNAIIEGDYLSGKAGEILIGQGMAELLEVEPGDRIVITLSEVDDGEMAQALFRVSGIFHFGLREIDENTVFANITKVREILGMTPDQSHEIAVRFVNPADADNPDTAIFNRFNTKELETLSWFDLNKAIGSMIEMSSYSSLIVGMVLFLLASLGVINSMFMSIYERIYEFGVIKAIGTRPGSLGKLILTEAFLIGLLSCVFGMSLGYLIGDYTSVHGVPLGELEVSGIAFDGKIMTRLTLDQFINFPIYVVLLTVIASIYPARFATRIVPTEALQRSL